MNSLLGTAVSGDNDDDDDLCLVTEVDLGAVCAVAGSRLNNSAALHRRAVRPQRQRPLTQYQPYTQIKVITSTLVM